MKTVYASLIILLLLSPGVETRKLGKLKRKKEGEDATDWCTLIPLAGFGFYFLASRIAGSVKYFTYKLNFHRVHDSLTADIKLKKESVNKMISYCEETKEKKNKIVTASIKLVSLIAHQGGNARDIQRLTDESFKNSKVNEEILLEATNEFNTKIMIELLKFLSNDTKESCEETLLSGIDNLNERIKLQKKTLADFKEKLDENRNLLVQLAIGIESYTDINVKELFKLCFGTNIAKCLKDVPSKYSSKDSIWKILLNNIVDALEVGVIYSSAYLGIMEKIDTSTFNFAGRITLATFEGFLILYAFLNESVTYCGFSKHIAESMINIGLKGYSKDINQQIFKFISSLNQVKNFSTTIKFYTMLADVLNRNQVNQSSSNTKFKLQIPEVDLRKLNTSVKFMNFVSNKGIIDEETRTEMNDPGLYFTDIEHTAKSDKTALLLNEGYEIISHFPKEGNKPELFILGRRTRDSNVVLFTSIYQMSEEEYENIGSDYQQRLLDKLKPSIYKEKFVDCENTSGKLDSIGKLYRLFDQAKLKLKLAESRYIIIAYISRDIYDHIDNKTFVNCLNKYKKDINGDEIYGEYIRENELGVITTRQNDFEDQKKKNIEKVDGEHALKEIKRKVTNSSYIYYFVKNAKLKEYFEKQSKAITTIPVGSSTFIYYTRDSIENIEKNIDFSNLFTDSSASKDKSYRERAKEYFYKFDNIESLLSQLSIEIKENKITYLPDYFSPVRGCLHGMTCQLFRGARTQKNLMINNSDKVADELDYISLNDYVQAYLDKELDTKADNITDKTVVLKKNENVEMPFWKVFTGYYHNNKYCKEYNQLFENPYVRSYLKEPKWKKGENILSALVYDPKIEYGQKSYKAIPKENVFKLSDLTEFSFKAEGDNTFIIHNLSESKKTILNNLINCEYASLAVEVELNSAEIQNPKIEIYPYYNDIEVNLVENADEEKMFKKEVVVTFTLVDVNKESGEFKKFNMKDNAERRYFTMGYFKIQSGGNESDFKIYTEDKSKYILVNFWSKVNIDPSSEDKEKSIEVAINDYELLQNKRNKSGKQNNNNDQNAVESDKFKDLELGNHDIQNNQTYQQKSLENERNYDKAPLTNKRGKKKAINWQFNRVYPEHKLNKFQKDN